MIDLLTWLYAVGPDGVLVPAHLHDAALFATGRVESRLWRLGVLGIDPTTDIDAFVWDGPPREELPTFYAVKARFYVQGLGPLRERVDDAIQELEAVLAGSWPQPWVEEATELAVSVLAGEAMRYLNHVVQRHRLPEANRDQSARFEVAARVALASYSLGQCYFLLWRAAKDGAAATKRNPMSLADGTGHAVNQFQRNVKWSGERGWEVKEYGAVRELPFTWQAQVLFERTLKVEVLAVHAREVKALAADRLDDDETVARLLAEGIPGDRAGDALERFRTSPSYGDSVDRLVEALRAVADSVQSAGGSASDALRAAYFSLEGLSVLGSSSDYELEEARLAIIEAVRG